MTDADDFLHLQHGIACHDLLETGGTQMIPYMIPLISEFLHPEFLEMWVYPIFGLCFIGSVPGLIRLFTSWR